MKYLLRAWFSNYKKGNFHEPVKGLDIEVRVSHLNSSYKHQFVTFKIPGIESPLVMEIQELVKILVAEGLVERKVK